MFEIIIEVVKEVWLIDECLSVIISGMLLGGVLNIFKDRLRTCLTILLMHLIGYKD